MLGMEAGMVQAQCREEGSDKEGGFRASDLRVTGPNYPGTESQNSLC